MAAKETVALPKDKFTYEDLVEISSFNCKPLTDEQKYDWLNIAITKFNDVDLMKELILEGVCVNFPPIPHGYEMSPLHYCVENDLLEGVSILVDAGADVNIRALKDYKPTPIHHAIAHDNLPMVKMLLAHGADPYCLIHGMGPVLNKPFSWDCFKMAKVFKNDAMISYFSEYKAFEKEKVRLMNLYWNEEPHILENVRFPTAVCVNGKIFVGDRLRHHQFLFMFDVIGRIWSKVSFYDSYHMYGFALVAISTQVHTLGGVFRNSEVEEEFSSKVFSLDIKDFKWFNTLPSLNVGRRRSASASFDNYIVVAGGYGQTGYLSSVEVLNSSQPYPTWWMICDLPIKSCFMQCTVSQDDLYVGCGLYTPTTVYTSKLSVIKATEDANDSESTVSSEMFWHSLPETPFHRSGLVSVNDCLITANGHGARFKLHSSVYLYDPFKKMWSKISNLRRSRWCPVIVVSTLVDRQELFVLCGHGADTSVESSELL